MVAKSLVYHQHGAHVVHDKADLIRTAARLQEAFVRSCHRGRQTHHHSVVEHRAVLEKGGANRERRGRKEGVEVKMGKMGVRIVNSR